MSLLKMLPVDAAPSAPPAALPSPLAASPLSFGAI